MNLDAGQQFLISIYINSAIVVAMGVATGLNLRSALRTRNVEAWLHTAFWALWAGYALMVVIISALNFVSFELRNRVIAEFMFTRNVESLLLLIFIVTLVSLPLINRSRWAKSLALFRAISASVEQIKAELEQALQREARLVQSNKSLENFAFAVSHDLRDPVSRIRSLVSILREDLALTGEALDIMQRIERAIGEAEAQVSGLLEFYRVNRDIAIQPVRLGEVLNSVLTMFKPFHIEIGPLPTVQADPRLMGIVFQNLLSNAIKFTNGKPIKVEISASIKNREHVIRVADNGIGIDNAYLDQIFVIFKRLHGASEFPGDGLGLSLVQRIVEAHGGRVWAESVEGEGSEFYFTLPL